MFRVTTGRTYGLVCLVYNTIGNLLTQDDQVRCFENAARHLTDDGVFVLECRVPTEGQHRGAPAEPVGERRERERREGREPDGGEPGAEHGPRQPCLLGQGLAIAQLAEVLGYVGQRRGGAELGEPRGRHDQRHAEHGRVEPVVQPEARARCARAAALVHAPMIDDGARHGGDAACR
jgi:hypothetical protein